MLARGGVLRKILLHKPTIGSPASSDWQCRPHQATTRILETKASPSAIPMLHWISSRIDGEGWS